MKKKYKRLNIIFFFLIGISSATFFILKALEEKVVFFYSPTEILKKQIKDIQTIRIGGLVLNNSVVYESDGLGVNFIITDNKNTIQVNYNGILPDLFREGQGVVAEGKIDRQNKIFFAKRVLAKHDENYMPPEVKKALN